MRHTDYKGGTDRQTDRERDRQTDRQTEKERDIIIETEGQ